MNIVGFNTNDSYYDVVTFKNCHGATLGDVVKVDSTWTDDKSLFGKYEVVLSYNHDGVEMISLISVDK